MLRIASTAIRQGRTVTSGARGHLVNSAGFPSRQRLLSTLRLPAQNPFGPLPGGGCNAPRAAEDAASIGLSLCSVLAFFGRAAGRAVLALDSLLAAFFWRSSSSSVSLCEQTRRIAPAAIREGRTVTSRAATTSQFREIRAGGDPRRRIARSKSRCAAASRRTHRTRRCRSRSRS
jgi:hypothetical protein